MSDKTGLTFDTSTVGGAFPMSRRGGYDIAAVDSFAHSKREELARVHAAIEKLSGENKKLAAENEDLNQQLDELEAKLETLSRPDFAGLGAHTSQLLALAEQEAAEHRKQARRDADKTRRTAEENVAELHAAAKRDLDQARMNQLNEAQARRDQILREAEARQAETLRDASTVREQAEQESERLRLAAQQEADALRLGAQREVEQARAAADREVTEARRVLAVEKERLAREATEHHAAATEQTAKLVADAEARAQAADVRSKESMSAAHRAHEQAKADGDRVIEDAKVQAAHIIATARSEVDKLRLEATHSADKRNRQLADETAVLETRRNGILEQLAKLREIVTEATGKEPELPTVEPVAIPEPAAEPVIEAAQPADTPEPVEPTAPIEAIVDELAAVVEPVEAEPAPLEPAKTEKTKSEKTGGSALSSIGKPPTAADWAAEADAAEDLPLPIAEPADT